MQDDIKKDVPSFGDYLEYAGFLVATGLLWILPVSIGAKIGKYFAKVFSYASGRSTSYIKNQMIECFGDKYSDDEYDQLVEKFYSHFGCLMVEAVRLKTLTKDNIDSIVSWGDSVETISRLKEETQLGVFFTTGHIGNWEFTGVASSLKGLLLGSIARPQDNPLIDKKVKEFREFSGQKIWDKEGAIVKLLQAIKRKNSVGVLIDQDGGEQGVKSVFLNRSASTTKTPIEMAMRMGAAILPCAMVRDGQEPMKFKTIIGKPVYTDKKIKTLDELIRITREVDDELSRIISDYPDQWLWIHKRWKTPNPNDIWWQKKYE